MGVTGTLSYTTRTIIHAYKHTQTAYVCIFPFFYSFWKFQDICGTGPKLKIFITKETLCHNSSIIPVLSTDCCSRTFVTFSSQHVKVVLTSSEVFLEHLLTTRATNKSQVSIPLTFLPRKQGTHREQSSAKGCRPYRTSKCEAPYSTLPGPCTRIPPAPSQLGKTESACWPILKTPSSSLA